MSGPETISVAELAKRWRMSYSTVARGIEEGKFPGTKIGSRFFILAQHVERYERGEPGPWSHGGNRTVNSPYIRTVNGAN
jgi:excisionase family DNA binding protein